MHLTMPITVAALDAAPIAVVGTVLDLIRNSPLLVPGVAIALIVGVALLFMRGYDLTADRLAAVDQPGIGRYLVPGLPLDFAAAPRLPPSPAPALGEHTDIVLSEVLGLSSTAIGRLHDERIVAGPDGR